MSTLVHARKISLYSCTQYRVSKLCILCAHTNKFKTFTLYIVYIQKQFSFFFLPARLNREHSRIFRGLLNTCLMHGVVLKMSKYCCTMSGCLSEHTLPSASTVPVNLNYDPSIKPGFEFQMLPSEKGCEIFRNLKCIVDGTEAGSDGFSRISFLLCGVTRICYCEKT
jgi:hypothetical protein